MPRALSSLFFRTFPVVFLFATWMSAQQSAPQNNQQDQDQEPVTTLRKDVNVVSIFFNVKDKHAAIIPDLTKPDFELYEDGKPQTIKYFSKESDLPLTLGLMIDTSPSQMRVLPAEQEAGAEFLKDVMRPRDLAFLMSFNVEVDLLRDLTSNPREIEKAMSKTRINAGGASPGSIPGIGQGPIPGLGNPKGTLLFDAVYLASREVLSHEVGRKAMIILTDGQDQGSNTRLTEAIEIAQKADAIVYVILCADRGFYGGGYYGERDMRKLTEETRGPGARGGETPGNS